MEFLSSVIVVSLFTNIPIELAVKSIEKRWDKIKKAISILKNELAAVSFVLDSASFVLIMNIINKILVLP